MNPEPIRDKRLAAAVTAVMAISTFDMSPMVDYPPDWRAFA